MNVNQKSCLLCETIANFDDVDGGNSQYFDCEFCKDFLVVGRANREPITESKRYAWSELSAALNDSQFLLIYYEHHQHNASIETKANLPKFGLNSKSLKGSSYM